MFITEDMAMILLTPRTVTAGFKGRDRKENGRRCLSESGDADPENWSETPESGCLESCLLTQT